jgi:hypothetical protein
MKSKNYTLLSLLCSIILIFITTNLTAQDYYPLEIGNRWDYERSYWVPGYPQEIDTFSVEVIDDSLFSNGKTYYVLNRSDLTGGRYVRADSDFVYYYDENDADEDTLYHLHAQPGEEWFLQFGAISFIRLDSISTSQIFTFPTTLLYYRLDGLILSYVTLSDKFGPVNFHSPGEPPGTSYTDKHLIGCVIDSIEYGNPVSVETDKTIPDVFTLYQNYPNPFNPSTTIRFTISDLRAGRQGLRFTTLKVYDILGKEVAILVNEEKTAGNYEVEFSTDLIHQTLPSGVYFYQLRAGEFIQTRKMVLLK